jgi:hypothetical protein
MPDKDIDTRRIDEAVLALMFLTLHEYDETSGVARAWKSFDWDVLDRLHAQDLIFDPVGKARSVALTPEGRRRCETLFYELFARSP